MEQVGLYKRACWTNGLILKFWQNRAPCVVRTGDDGDDNDDEDAVDRR